MGKGVRRFGNIDLKGVQNGKGPETITYFTHNKIADNIDNNNMAGSQSVSKFGLGSTKNIGKC